jgi:hypothetical protein
MAQRLAMEAFKLSRWRASKLSCLSKEQVKTTQIPKQSECCVFGRVSNLVCTCLLSKNIRCHFKHTTGFKGLQPCTPRSSLWHDTLHVGKILVLKDLVFFPPYRILRGLSKRSSGLSHAAAATGMGENPLNLCRCRRTKSKIVVATRFPAASRLVSPSSYT